MAEKSLKHKAATGMVWTAVQKYVKMFVSFVSGIILARLLTPYDYGCIGMLSIFMVLADSFIDGGFASALIQKKRPTQEDYSTVFWWNLAMATVMYAILFFSAPAIARFYKIDLLCDVLRVQALVLFIYAFGLVQKNQLRKQLRFKLLAIVRIATSVISLSVTIYLAYNGYGVWALVSNNIIASLLPVLVYWFYVKWRPKLIFSWHSFKELFGFGFYMFLTHLLNNFGSQLQGLLIGRIYNPTTMGYYSKAAHTETLASHSISSVMTSVTYPLYAAVQDDKPRLAGMIKKLTQTIAFITFPAMFILILIAEPLFVLLYSDRWLLSVPYFQVLCIAGLAGCLTAVNTQTIAAIGKSKVMFTWTLIKRICSISFVVAGVLLWGMKGLLCGVILNYWFSYYVNIMLVSKYIGYKWVRQIMDLLPIAVVSMLAAAISYGVGWFLHLDLYPDGIVKLLVYLLVYVAWVLLFKPEAYTFFLTTIPEKFRVWERWNVGKKKSI